MSLKKKRKSSCPFASANRADVLATIVIKNKIDLRTIPFVLAGRKLKAKVMTNLTNPQNGPTRVVAKLAGQSTIAGDRLQENLLTVSCRFCHADMTLLEKVSARTGLRSCWIVSYQNEDCLSRTVHFSNHMFLGALAFRSCNFLLDICTRTSLKVSLFTQTLFPCLRHLSSCFVRRNVNPH